MLSILLHCVIAHLGKWVYGERENDGGRWFKKKISCLSDHNESVLPR
jgi:hypothetical protein